MKRIFAFAAMLSVATALLPVWGLAQSKEDAIRLHKEAYALQEKAQSHADMKQAEEKFLQAIAIYQRVGERKNAALAYNSIGLIYASWGQYDKAVEYYEKSLAISREFKDRKGEGATLNNLGEVFRLRSQYDKAVEYYEKSLAIARELKNRQSEGAPLTNLGLVYKDWGQYDKAVEYYEKNLAICREFRDRKGEGQTLNALASVYKDWGQYDKSVEYYEKSLAISRAVKDRNGEGSALNNLGGVYRDWWQSDKAVEYYEKSLAIFREVNSHAGEGAALNNLGNVYRSWGQCDKAVEYYQKSLAIKRELGDRKGEGQTLHNLGGVYMDWGQSDKAVEYYQKSLAISREFKDRKTEGQTLINLGAVYKDWGQYDKAVEHYQKSLAIKRELKDPRGEGQTLINLGSIFATQGQYSEALATFQKGLETFRRIGLPTVWATDSIGNLYLDMSEVQKAEPFIKEANYRSSLGRLGLMKADYSSAKKYYESLLKVAEQNRNADNLFTAYTGLGKAHEGSEDYKKAEECYEKGMKLTEEIRSGLLPAERKDFFEVKINGFQRSEPAKGLTRVRMKLNQAGGSIDSSEATRARAFSDNIALTTKAVTGVPHQVLQKENELVSKVAALKKQLSKTDKEASPATYGNISQQVQDAETELNTFVQVLWVKYKAYASVKYPRPVTLKESSLKPEEYVVIFDASGEGVGVKLIKGKEIAQTFYTKWKSEDLEKDVKEFRQAFEEMKLKEFDPELGKTLYKKLLLSVLAHVPEGTPLVIIPDGILAVLPFEALVVSGKPMWNEGSGKHYPEGLTYLGDVYPISYYQSITALTLTRTLKADEKKGSKTLVVADPVFDSDDARLKAVAGARKQEILGAAPEKLMSIKKQTGLTFGRLDRTSELGQSLKKLNPDKTDLFIGLQATKSIFFDKPLTDYASIVLATHGYFGNDIPEIREPVIVMSLVDQPKDQDGFLRMTEVMGMKLNADVVALTACQTGIGKNLSGEGVMSMGRAFQYAGAKSILMSLWSVSENASVLLVEKFFEHLKEGKNKLDALKSARADVRKAGYDHPFYWAPFILVGEVN